MTTKRPILDASSLATIICGPHFEGEVGKDQRCGDPTCDWGKANEPLFLDQVMELSHPIGLGGCDYAGSHYIDSECDAKLSAFMEWWREQSFKQSQLIVED